MTRARIAASCLIVALAVAGCGRYGPPVRAPKPAPAASPASAPPAEPAASDESGEAPQP